MGITASYCIASNAMLSLVEWGRPLLRTATPVAQCNVGHSKVGQRIVTLVPQRIAMYGTALYREARNVRSPLQRESESPNFNHTRMRQCEQQHRRNRKQ